MVKTHIFTTHIVTKHKLLWQNSKCEQLILQWNSNCDKTQIVTKLELCQYLKTQIVKETEFVTTIIVTKFKLNLVRTTWQLDKLMRCTYGRLLKSHNFFNEFTLPLYCTVLPTHLKSSIVSKFTAMCCKKLI